MLSALHSEIQRRQKVLPNQIVKPQHKNNNKENVRNNCCPITKEIKIQRYKEREKEREESSKQHASQHQIDRLRQHHLDVRDGLLLSVQHGKGKSSLLEN